MKDVRGVRSEGGSGAGQGRGGAPMCGHRVIGCGFKSTCVETKSSRDLRRLLVLSARTNYVATQRKTSFAPSKKRKIKRLLLLRDFCHLQGETTYFSLL